MMVKHGTTRFLAGAIALALSAQASALTLYGITGPNNLISFDSATPGMTSAPLAITGLAAGDSIVGIDVRPANGALFGLGSGSRIYSLNPTTGVATPVGAAGAFALSGTSFGFDFNPVPDRIRVTSNNDQSLRLNPDTGALAATDSMLAFAGTDVNAGTNPNIVGSAYTNSIGPSPRTPPPGTLLYGIDSSLDILVTQDPPNDGILNTVGALGVNTSDQVGFDIFAPGNLAFASLTDGTSGFSSLYSINLTTGAATLIGGIGSGLAVRDIAVAQIPLPGSMALLIAGLAGMLGVYRRKA
ncbi:MAG: DUF4394 domain-containing protein [Proteobacteria bacterium]|nr:DUF4394 domain-containing protein [Burkholderiales bacterium]